MAESKSERDYKLEKSKDFKIATKNILYAVFLIVFAGVVSYFSVGKQINDLIEYQKNNQKTQFYSLMKDKGILNYLKTGDKIFLEDAETNYKKMVEITFDINLRGGSSQKQNLQTIN